MAVKSLEILYCGSGYVDKGVLTYHVDSGKIVEVPYMCFLIRTDDGNVLFDTGFNPDDIAKLKSMGRRLNITERDFLPNRLQEVGISPEEVNTVIVSHLHWDHAGFIGAVSHAEIIVQRVEYAFAFNAPPYARMSYFRSDFDIPELRWRLLDGDEVLMPGITAIFTPGHSPGHQSLMVELPETGTIILAADCGFLLENFENETIPGVFVNPSDALHSIKKIKLLAQVKRAQIMPTHDMQMWKAMKKPPESYK